MSMCARAPPLLVSMRHLASSVVVAMDLYLSEASGLVRIVMWQRVARGCVSAVQHMSAHTSLGTQYAVGWTVRGRTRFPISPSYLLFARRVLREEEAEARSDLARCVSEAPSQGVEVALSQSGAIGERKAGFEGASMFWLLCHQTHFGGCWVLAVRWRNYAF